MSAALCLILPIALGGLRVVLVDDRFEVVDVGRSLLDDSPTAHVDMAERNAMPEHQRAGLAFEIGHPEQRLPVHSEDADAVDLTETVSALYNRLKDRRQIGGRRCDHSQDLA